MKNENEKKKDAKQDLLIIDAETGLLSHPSTLECVSPNSGILFPNFLGSSSERINLYINCIAGNGDIVPTNNMYKIFPFLLL